MENLYQVGHRPIPTRTMASITDLFKDMDKPDLTSMRRRNRVWPFKDMNTTDKNHVVIPLSDWPAAQNVMNARRHRRTQDFTWQKMSDVVHVWCTYKAAETAVGKERRAWGLSSLVVGGRTKAYPIALLGKAQLAAYAVARRQGFEFSWLKNEEKFAIVRTK